jgi:hypothetical protein
MDTFNKYKLVGVGALLGAVAGWAYQSYTGCADGKCIITSSPVISILYGALIGALLLSTFSKQQKHF